MSKNKSKLGHRGVFRRVYEPKTGLDISTTGFERTTRDPEPADEREEFIPEGDFEEYCNRELKDILRDFKGLNSYLYDLQRRMPTVRAFYDLQKMGMPISTANKRNDPEFILYLQFRNTLNRSRYEQRIRDIQHIIKSRGSSLEARQEILDEINLMRKKLRVLNTLADKCEEAIARAEREAEERRKQFVEEIKRSNAYKISQVLQQMRGLQLRADRCVAKALFGREVTCREDELYYEMLEIEKIVQSGYERVRDLIGDAPIINDPESYFHNDIPDSLDNDELEAIQTIAAQIEIIVQQTEEVVNDCRIKNSRYQNTYDPFRQYYEWDRPESPTQKYRIKNPDSLINYAPINIDRSCASRKSKKRYSDTDERRVRKCKYNRGFQQRNDRIIIEETLSAMAQEKEAELTASAWNKFLDESYSNIS